MRLRLCAIVLVLASLAASGSGTDTQWSTLSGAKANPLAPQKRPSVLFFLLADCPIANLYAPEIKRIIHDYSAKGVIFSLVYVDSSITIEEVKRHRNEYGLAGQSLLDPTHSLSQRVGATVSPEAVVLNPAGHVIYLGRIDDRVLDYGKVREKPTRRDLRLSLDLALKGKPLSTSKTKAIGCIFRAVNERTPD